MNSGGKFSQNKFEVQISHKRYSPGYRDDVSSIEVRIHILTFAWQEIFSSQMTI